MTSRFTISYCQEIFEVRFESDGPARNRAMSVIYSGFVLDVAEIRMSHPNLYAEIKKKMDEESKKWWAVQPQENITDSIKKSSLVVVFILFSLFSFAQKNEAIFSADLGYSFHYKKIGFGLNGGYHFDHNYLGVDTHLYFSQSRNIPVEVDLHYGYNIGSLQPFVTAGFYTCGGEAVHNHEGVCGIAFGAGMSYFFPRLPLKLTTGITGNNIYSSLAIVARL